MGSEVSSLWNRLQALARLLNELRARVTALEARCAALEQQQSQRWYQ